VGLFFFATSLLKRGKLVINFRGSTSAFLVTAAMLLPLVLIGQPLSTPPIIEALEIASACCPPNVCTLRIATRLPGASSGAGQARSNPSFQRTAFGSR